MSAHLWQWLVLAATLILLGYLGWKKPHALVFVLAAAVALEISRTWYPALGSLGKALGTVDLARLTTLAIIITAAAYLVVSAEKRQLLGVALRRPLTWSLLLYIGLGAGSMLYSVDKQATAVEVVRLFILLLLCLSIVVISRKQDVLVPLQVVHAVGLLLLPLTIYEVLTKHFVWQQFLATVNPPRVNATFVDPNIFARYLVLAIVANVVLQYLADTKGQRIFYLGALLGLITELAVTLSRSGMVTVVLVLGLMLLLKPEKRVLKPIGLVAILGVLLAIIHPTVWQRILTFGQGMQALDPQRLYLWRVAGAMFHDHPILGVGMGGFQKSFLTHYLKLKTISNGVTLSHTTILTIAAELGVLGLAVLAAIWILLSKFMWGLRSAGRRTYILGIGYFLWILTVFISSQAEARFFEDPVMWLAIGMLFTVQRVYN
ncbi:MAG: O-antigen ligase family protein [Peptococcaceae bacterium]|nr:O-antigen ligase family protein [Peptococcaceae bacterium]